MQILTAGHKYIAANFENPSNGQTIQFIEKQLVPASDPNSLVSHALQTVNDGTTNEELLAILIDRLQFLNAKQPCRENSIVITKLEESLMWLNKREPPTVRHAESRVRPLPN